MPGRLLVVNACLALVAAGAGAATIRDLTRPVTLPVVAPAVGRPIAAEPADPAVPQAAPAGAYGVVATRNLFSPTRSESDGLPVAAPAAAPAPARVFLHGVVLRDGPPVAYLEDTATKRVAGYRLGDTVGGGSLKSIAADHVVIVRPEGPLDVRLRDPAKPRPPAPAPPTAARPARPAAAPAATPPAVGDDPPPTILPPAGQPQAVQPPAVPRRTLPPSLLRRAVPGQPGDGAPTD